ncbi:intraflagellar transport protein 52 homolog [Coccinella septempunctata]|uniref:intraflagellar transport protein 52 homolog n=1 Tax=Coccinella septempunctata TaxID=41139 RepID=UPI001D07D3F7|nr:intraflagellar transport protein 52 homolog [Coccinella septempunctata]
MDLVDNKNTIIINASRNELYRVHENWKILHRKLKIYWKVVINTKDELSMQLLANCELLILPGPQSPFEENELNALNTFINKGGRILVLLSEPTPNDKSNIHIFLEEYGIIPNVDVLTRTHYYKYFHPKEVYISDSDFNTCLKTEKENMAIIYPFGCTISVNKPAAIAFTSGSASFPADQALGAIYFNRGTSGKIVALGSGYLFSDKYIDQENNDKLRETVISFLVDNKEVTLSHTDHDEIDIMERNILPNTEELASKPKLCLTDAISHTLSVDHLELLEHRMYSINTNLVANVLNLYEDLKVKHQPLKLITPLFEAPYPPLQPAVFPPAFRDLPLPPLELFDLDDAFSSVFSKLAQFTNKFLMESVGDVQDDGLRFYISECAKIVKVDEEVSDPKDILHEIGSQIAKFKSIETIA